MQNVKMGSAILTSALCCSLSAPASAQNQSKPTSAKTVSALVLNQKHIYLGNMKVLLVPDAIKMVCLGKFRFSLISKAPKWDVTVYRTDDRLICSQSLESFCDQGLFSNMVLRQKSRVMPGGNRCTKKFSGFTVLQYTWPDTIFEGLPIKGIAAPQAESILHAAYKLPTQGQVPLRWEVTLTGKDWMTNLSEKGMRRLFLGTDKISKLSVPVSEFDVPAGLKREKSITRIVVGDSGKMKETGVDVLFGLEK